jgi:hypothetical protein
MYPPAFQICKPLQEFGLARFRPRVVPVWVRVESVGPVIPPGAGVAEIHFEPSLVQTFPLAPGAGRRGSTSGPRMFGLIVTVTFCALETVTVIGKTAFGVNGVTVILYTGFVATDTFTGQVWARLDSQKSTAQRMISRLMFTSSP